MVLAPPRRSPQDAPASGRPWRRARRTRQIRKNLEQVLERASVNIAHEFRSSAGWAAFRRDAPPARARRAAMAHATSDRRRASWRSDAEAEASLPVAAEEERRAALRTGRLIRQAIIHRAMNLLPSRRLRAVARARSDTRHGKTWSKEKRRTEDGRAEGRAQDRARKMGGRKTGRKTGARKTAHVRPAHARPARARPDWRTRDDAPREGPAARKASCAQERNAPGARRARCRSRRRPRRDEMAVGASEDMFAGAEERDMAACRRRRRSRPVASRPFVIAAPFVVGKPCDDGAVRGTAAIALAILLFLLASLPQAQGTAPATPLTLLSREGRRPVPTIVLSGQELVALDDVATLFQVAVREDTLAGGLTITYRGPDDRRVQRPADGVGQRPGRGAALSGGSVGQPLVRPARFSSPGARSDLRQRESTSGGRLACSSSETCACRG